MKELKSQDRAAVTKLAVELARKYKNKDVAIGLVGPLGAGKTAFTKDFARALGIKKIKSPTFIVGSVYPIGKRQLYHYDFYRLEKPAQLKPLDFDDILASKNRIVLIEWADKFPQIAKQCDLVITFGFAGKNLRHVTIS
jgi:tRNA threonylcarbamoyladenosine biosynthesis protein TsaE